MDPLALCRGGYLTRLVTRRPRRAGARGRAGAGPTPSARPRCQTPRPVPGRMDTGLNENTLAPGAAADFMPFALSLFGLALLGSRDRSRPRGPVVAHADGPALPARAVACCPALSPRRTTARCGRVVQYPVAPGVAIDPDSVSGTRSSRKPGTKGHSLEILTTCGSGRRTGLAGRDLHSVGLPERCGDGLRLMPEACIAGTCPGRPEPS